jgi:chorismate mutase
MRSVGLNMPHGLTPQHGSSSSTPRSTPRAASGNSVPARSGAAGRDEAMVGIMLDPTAAPAVPGAGLVVRHVWPGSPADMARVLPGDILLAIDSAPAVDAELATAALRGPAGSSVALAFRREGTGRFELPALERAPPMAVRALDEAVERLQRLAGEGRGSPAAAPPPEALAEALAACVRARTQMVEDRRRVVDDIAGAAEREGKAAVAATRRDAVLVEIAVAAENPRGDPQIRDAEREILRIGEASIPCPQTPLTSEDAPLSLSLSLSLSPSLSFPRLP